ncbi:Fe-Mn family superoxide dismutase [Desulforamulus ruminis]|uniref:superoxide dismutase n=1 Tax=Desulforamulus ruminis (strain ATCC 23193 / DSM 2154 / NCIMB 8452 / DL) TaxID=696281 RepID=F6DSU9_DESRL|nr:Fe-Mn family superoxide dismutase [Desulforamulus ruminis]AEG59943.1 Manganese/iron superoxide dismutase-like protein [Desulforamulus ruminis DSM 2154]
MPKHIVKPGDTIKNIMKKYKIDLDALILANPHLNQFERLSPGDTVYIPGFTDGTFAQLEIRPLKPSLLTMLGLSVRQIQEHYALYQGYVSKTNEIRSKLGLADRTETNTIFSSIRSLKKEEAFAINGCKLHEWYFDNLGGRGGPVNGPILQAIVKDFGSSEYWEKDFRATGSASRGWAILGFDLDDGHLHNYGLDANDCGSVFRFEPILVMDVHEHAYFLDYGTNRTSYMEAFFKNIDWAVVNSRWISLKQISL